MRLRFAPSPTGLLHVGNARTALFNWLFARHSGAAFVLRIEDTDTERSTREFEDRMLDDLRWLGLTWDEGPDIGGAYAPYRQIERLEIYADYARRLRDADRAYYCFCTAEQLEADRRAALAAGQQPRYDGRCRAIARTDAEARITGGELAALRFRVHDDREVAFDDRVRGRIVFNTSVFGDPVIVRSDGRPAYNFAVVVDDGLMGITHVVRGEDHVPNTPRQILICEALGFTVPEFAHVSLVLGPDHAPLSKRHGATSVSEFRDRGYLPEALVNYLALLGWSPGEGDELLPLDELVRRFSIDDVGKSAGVFDFEKLAWANRHAQRAADPARLARVVGPYLVEAGFATRLDDRGYGYLASRLLPIVVGAVDRLEQAPARLRTVFDFDATRAIGHAETRTELMQPAARGVVVALAEEAAAADRLISRDLFRALVARVRERVGLKGRALMHPMRLALTGEADGPELDLLVPAIDEGVSLGAHGWRAIPGVRERAAAIRLVLEQ